MFKHKSIVLAIASLLIATLACRPVIAIGWEELLIIIILVAFLLGPMLFRLYRFLDKVNRFKRSEEKKKK